MAELLVHNLVNLLLLAAFGAAAAMFWVRLSQLEAPKPNDLPLSVVMQDAPYPVWVEDGILVWGNDRYHQLISAEGRKPGIAAFDPVDGVALVKGYSTFSLTGGDTGAQQTYLVHERTSAGGIVYVAKEITALVETERDLNRFIQTLSVTFAHLPIGLAVFDKRKDLTLFNPALASLLGLRPDWLVRRPSIQEFLDRLHNQGSIPEPKDYHSLRQEFVQLESGAFEGEYASEWVLPTGKTYRVTGRPHAQGGAALMVEDVTQIVAVEQKYRGELALFHAALENLSDGVAIFDQGGTLIYANDVFDALWGCKMSTSLATITAKEASRVFQKNCYPTPVWGDLRDFINDPNERSQWRAGANLKDGTQLQMTFSPLVGGCTFCEFSTGFDLSEMSNSGEKIALNA